MHPPAHVCKALYAKYPDLRLAWHGQWGKFCIVKLSPKRMTKKHGSAFYMFDSMWDTAEAVMDNGGTEKVADSKGPVFNRHGTTRPDWDILSTDLLMQDICETNDVFSSRVVKMIQYRSRKEELHDQAQDEHEKGKMLRDNTIGNAESTADKIKYFANRHDGQTTNLARKHIEDYNTVDKVDPTLPGLEYYHVNKRGLKDYL